MVEFYNVTKAYDKSGEFALNNVSFNIKKGEFVFIIGATGAGKTTITKLILKEELQDDGDIYINNRNLLVLKRRELPFFRRQIGTVFQDFRLLPYKTVFENVAFAMEVVGTSRRTINHMVPQILSLTGLEKKADKLPRNYRAGNSKGLLLRVQWQIILRY